MMVPLQLCGLCFEQERGLQLLPLDADKLAPCVMCDPLESTKDSFQIP